jgi:hypothetical protein
VADEDEEEVMTVEDTIAQDIASRLSEPMREALSSGMPDMFDGAKVQAHGPVMGALRKRGIVAAAPHRHLTPLGAQVAQQVRL